MSQQEVECALHIEQIVHQLVILITLLQLFVSCQSADGNEPHVKESTLLCIGVHLAPWETEKIEEK